MAEEAVLESTPWATTRSLQVGRDLPAPPDRVFAALHTPSAIRGGWSAARALVVPEEGGIWAAAWGEAEDEPDYVTVASIILFDPPRRLILGDYRYWSKDGPLPFKADLTTEFIVLPADGGCRLEVIQEGFPAESVADDFYAGCQSGWQRTFDGIEEYLQRG